VPVAVVSANAFDQGLDNDVGLPPADFLVKPVRLPTLLDWLGRRLDLAWVEDATAKPPALPARGVPGAEETLPSPDQLPHCASWWGWLLRGIAASWTRSKPPSRRVRALWRVCVPWRETCNWTR
jgi:hypothetical protein